MRIGIVFPQDGLAADATAVRDFAQAVEDLGYTHLLVYDHVLGADPSRHKEWLRYTHRSVFHEPFLLFSYLAAITRRIELVTGVLVLPQRQTALVAKQAAYLDRLSQARLRMGIGVGWNAAEYEAMGADFHNRGARAEEQIAVLRALWSQEVVTFQGRWHQITAAGINPRPPRGSIPIWIGGAAEAVLERVGRLADGWMPERRFIGPQYRDYPHEPWAAMLERVHGYARRSGRDPRCIGVEARLDGTDADALALGLEQWNTLGATHVSVSIHPLNAPPCSVDAYIDRLRGLGPIVGSQISALDMTRA